MINILIVDDKASVTGGLKKLIPWSELNARVVAEASNGKEAFEIALEKRPDVVITDVRMPVMDGLTLCRKIHEVMPHTFKIVLSAYDDFSYAREAMQYGVMDYVLKPIDSDKIRELTEKIRLISRRQHSRKTLQSMMSDPHLKSRIFEALKQGDTDTLETLFDSQLSDTADAGGDLVNDWFLKLFTMLLEFTDEIGFSFTNIGMSKEQAWSQVLSMKDPDEMNGRIKELYLAIASAIQSKRDSRAEALAGAVKRLIAERFTDPNLSVNTIAEDVGVTPNYISAIYHQVTGEHISSSITDMRMKKAKSLLRQPGLSIHLAAVQCGYTDAHYFARVFKKAEGLTPSQFRNLQGDEGK